MIPHENLWFDTWLTRYFLGVVDYFVVMSKSVESDLLKLYPGALHRYSPHPIYDIFGDHMDKADARRCLGITANKVILYFGYIRRYKGLDILIEATGRMKRQMEDFVVLAVGECYNNENIYRNAVQEKNLSDVFDLRMNFIPDKAVATYFSAADIVGLPYKSATQSGIVPIAYHFNKPVLVTDVGGLPEIISHGQVGYVVEANNPKAVADALVDFFENDRSELMVNNVLEYKHRFTWDNFVDTIDELVGA